MFKIDKNVIFTIFFIAVTLLTAVFNAFGYGDWHPDAQLQAILALIVPLIGLIIAAIQQMIAAHKRAELEDSVLYWRAQAVAGPKRHES